MKDRRVLVLYGSSLFVAGLETCLKDKSGMEVVRVRAGTPNAVRRVKSFCPDVIVFDGNDRQFGNLSGTTQWTLDNPNALIVGLDLASNNVTFLCSQQCSVNTSDDIVDAIRAAIGFREDETKRHEFQSRSFRSDRDSKRSQRRNNHE